MQASVKVRKFARFLFAGSTFARITQNAEALPLQLFAECLARSTALLDFFVELSCQGRGKPLKLQATNLDVKAVRTPFDGEDVSNPHQS